MDDETRDYLHSLFGSPPPRDVVRGTGLTREDVIRQNDLTGQAVQITVPGEIVEDTDGSIIGITSATTESGIFGGTYMTRSQLDAVGLTPDDVPKIRIIEPK